jgi:dTDP-4-amino-4,6-dideoxygalactose transaminase
VYETYRRELDGIAGLRLLEFDESQPTSYKNIVAEVTDDFVTNRDELVRQLNSAGILARAHYHPPLHAKTTYQYPVRISDVTNAELSKDRFINLPCGQRVDEDAVVTTCKLIRTITTATGS